MTEMGSSEAGLQADKIIDEEETGFRAGRCITDFQPESSL